MTAQGQLLARKHQLAQINNGTLAAALIMEFGDQLRTGRLPRDEFVAAVVAQGRLSHDAANRLAVQFTAEYRAIEAPHRSHATPVRSEFDAAAALGRAVGTLADLDTLDVAARDYDTEFWALIEGLAVRQHKAALNGGREVIEFSAAANGTRWRRVTDGNPCAWCAMLATRSDYRTKESALYVQGGQADDQPAGGAMARRRRSRKRRGKRTPGESYHRNCGCTAVEVLGEWEMSPAEKAQHDLYERAAKACDDEGTPRNEANVLGKMREYGGGVIHDAHVPATQAGGGSSGGSLPPAVRSPASAPDGRGWPEGQKPATITLTPRWSTHITTGDVDGGGHLYGIQPPPGVKKRWFPEDWTEQRIVDVVKRVAQDPRVVTTSRDGAFFNCYDEFDRVRVKVRVYPNGSIVTGHPIDGDGVMQIEVKTDGSVHLKEVPYGASREVAW